MKSVLASIVVFVLAASLTLGLLTLFGPISPIPEPVLVELTVQADDSLPTNLISTIQWIALAHPDSTWRRSEDGSLIIWDYKSEEIEIMVAYDYVAEYAQWHMTWQGKKVVIADALFDYSSSQEIDQESIIALSPLLWQLYLESPIPSA